MLIHRGRGGLIALIAFLCPVVLELVTSAQFHNDHYFQQHGWPRLTGFLLAAAIVWWLSPRTVRHRPHPQQQDWLVSSSSTVPGPTSSGLTGSSDGAERSPFRPRIFRPTDSLFFIPARFWPLILCALGVLFALIPADAFA